MLEFGQVDREKSAPPYEQIADMLRHAITSRRLDPGERLPAEAKLAKYFGVARMTVRRAVQELREEGLVVSAPGRGVAVRPAPAIKELWPQEPGFPTEVTIPDFNAWGNVAPLIAQVENIRTRMHTLTGDIIEVGLQVGDPLVVSELLRTLGGIALAQADVLSTLATRLRLHVLDDAIMTEVFREMETARRDFVEACGALQSAAQTLRNYTSASPDLPTAVTVDPSSGRAEH